MVLFNAPGIYHGTQTPPDFGGTLAVAFGRFIYTDITTKTLFTLPKNAVPIWWAIVVKTAFDAGTLNDVDLGTSASAAAFANNLDVDTVGYYDPSTALSVLTPLGVMFTEETDITAIFIPTGTSVTEGTADVYMVYAIREDDFEIE